MKEIVNNQLGQKGGRKAKPLKHQNIADGDTMAQIYPTEDYSW
jgi:hypothetical protein